MSNSLNAELTDRYVVVRADAMKPEFRDIAWRVWHCEGGFGCSPHTSGRMVAAECIADGERADIRNMIERFATDEEVSAARKLRGDRNTAGLNGPVLS